MRILVIGSNGQLGRDMTALCCGEGHAVEAVDVPVIDITDAGATDVIVQNARPDIIINCAAYTAVDAAETNESAAFAVNAAGTANIARAAARCGAAMVHFSTDYVFDGTAARPYVETDEPRPVSVYGKSKLAGERMLAEVLHRHFILRIAWLYGMHGGNFVKTIRDAAVRKKKAGQPLRVVNDQIGSPTHTIDVCRQTLTLIATGAFGLYHATSEGCCTWYDFAQAIVAAAGIDVQVEPCSTAEFPRPAPRPAAAVLENQALKKLGINRMPQWQDGFAEFLRREKALCNDSIHEDVH